MGNAVAKNIRWESKRIKKSMQRVEKSAGIIKQSLWQAARQSVRAGFR